MTYIKNKGDTLLNTYIHSSIKYKEKTGIIISINIIDEKLKNNSIASYNYLFPDKYGKSFINTHFPTSNFICEIIWDPYESLNTPTINILKFNNLLGIKNLNILYPYTIENTLVDINKYYGDMNINIFKIISEEDIISVENELTYTKITNEKGYIILDKSNRILL